MNLNRKELKKIQRNFNAQTSRMFQSNFQDYDDNLRKYVNYIKNTPLIFEYIVACGYSLHSNEQIVKDVFSNHHQSVFRFGDTVEDEVSGIFGVLEEIVLQGYHIPYSIGLAYSSSAKYQDHCDAFNSRVIKILHQHIETYLTELGIDMGVDGVTKYHVENGQIIVANDNSTVNNEFEQHVGLEDFENIANTLLSAAQTIPEEDLEELKEGIDMIKSQIKSSTPNKGKIRFVLNALKAIPTIVGLGADFTALVQYIQTAGFLV